MADFIEKVKHGIDKGVNVASVKTREIRDMSRLKNQLGILCEQLKTAYSNLGEFTYDLYRVKNLDQKKLAEKCQEVEKLLEQVRQKEVEIKEIRIKSLEAMGKQLCSGCEAILPNGAKFCMGCGQKMPGQSEKITEEDDDVILIPFEEEDSKLKK